MPPHCCWPLRTQLGGPPALCGPGGEPGTEEPLSKGKTQALGQLVMELGPVDRRLAGDAARTRDEAHRTAVRNSRRPEPTVGPSRVWRQLAELRSSTRRAVDRDPSTVLNDLTSLLVARIGQSCSSSGPYLGGSGSAVVAPGLGPEATNRIPLVRWSGVARSTETASWADSTSPGAVVGTVSESSDRLLHRSSAFRTSRHL